MPDPTRKAKARDLTGKQRAFIEAYFVNGFVGWRAAQAAGYSGDERDLQSIASQNLRKIKVSREIERRWKQIAMPAEEVIGRLAEIARGDVDALLDDTGAYDRETARRAGKTYLVKKQKITEKYIPQQGKEDIVIRTTEIELHDAQAALNTLAKYHGLLTERLKIDDWRSEAVASLKNGEITPEAAIDVFGDELARELFALAGVKVEGRG